MFKLYAPDSESVPDVTLNQVKQTWKNSMRGRAKTSASVRVAWTSGPLASVAQLLRFTKKQDRAYESKITNHGDFYFTAVVNSEYDATPTHWAYMCVGPRKWEWRLSDDADLASWRSELKRKFEQYVSTLEGFRSRLSQGIEKVDAVEKEFRVFSRSNRAFRESRPGRSFVALLQLLRFDQSIDMLADPADSAERYRRFARKPVFKDTDVVSLVLDRVKWHRNRILILERAQADMRRLKERPLWSVDRQVRFLTAMVKRDPILAADKGLGELLDKAIKNRNALEGSLSSMEIGSAAQELGNARKLCQLGRRGEALQRLEKLPLSAHGPRTRLLMGQLELELGYPLRAQTTFKAVNTDDNALAQAGLALAGLNLGQPIDALLKTVLAARSKSPDDAFVLWATAKCFIASDDLSGATEVARKLVDSQPMCPEAHILVAIISGLRRDEKVRVFEAERSLELDPASPRTLVRVAEVHAAVSADESAEDAASQALALQADYIPALWSRARIRQKSNRLGPALTDISRALQANPEHVGCLITKELILIRQGEYRSALDTVEELIELQPNSKDHVVKKAYVLIKLNENEKAAEYCQSKISVLSGEPLLYYLKGVALSRSDKLSEAHRAFTAGISFAGKREILPFFLPGNVKASNDQVELELLLRYERGLVSYRLGHDEATLVDLKHVLTSGKGGFDDWLLAWFALRGLTDKATKLLQRLGLADRDN